MGDQAHLPIELIIRMAMHIEAASNGIIKEIVINQRRIHNTDIKINDFILNHQPDFQPYVFNIFYAKKHHEHQFCKIKCWVEHLLKNNPYKLNAGNQNFAEDFIYISIIFFNKHQFINQTGQSFEKFVITLIESHILQQKPLNIQENLYSSQQNQENQQVFSNKQANENNNQQQNQKPSPSKPEGIQFQMEMDYPGVQMVVEKIKKIITKCALELTEEFIKVRFSIIQLTLVFQEIDLMFVGYETRNLCSNYKCHPFSEITLEQFDCSHFLQYQNSRSFLSNSVKSSTDSTMSNSSSTSTSSQEDQKISMIKNNQYDDLQSIPIPNICIFLQYAYKNSDQNGMLNLMLRIFKHYFQNQRICQIQGVLKEKINFEVDYEAYRIMCQQQNQPFLQIKFQL